MYFCLRFFFFIYSSSFFFFLFSRLLILLLSYCCFWFKCCICLVVAYSHTNCHSISFSFFSVAQHTKYITSFLWWMHLNTMEANNWPRSIFIQDTVKIVTTNGIVNCSYLESKTVQNKMSSQQINASLCSLYHWVKVLFSVKFFEFCQKKREGNTRTSTSHKLLFNTSFIPFLRTSREKRVRELLNWIVKKIDCETLFSCTFRRIFYNFDFKMDIFNITGWKKKTLLKQLYPIKIISLTKWTTEFTAKYVCIVYYSCCQCVTEMPDDQRNGILRMLK